MYKRILAGFLLFLLSCSLSSSPARAATFANSATITINDDAAAAPYPASITVSGLSGNVTKVRVTLNRFSHAYPEDVDILLVGPQGQKTLLMSDAGDNSPLVNELTLTFDDAAASPPPEFGEIFSGTYQPSDFVGYGDDVFPPDAPAGPYSATLSVFNNTNPNGVWKLYVRDDYPEAVGEIKGGWSLEITTSSAAFSDLSVSQNAPAQVKAGDWLTYTLSVANAGPDPAPTAFFSDTLPTGATFQALMAPAGWNCQTPPIGTSGLFSCSKSNFAVNQAANFTLTLQVKPGLAVDTLLTNQVAVATSGNDPQPANNSNRLDSVVVSNLTFTASGAITINDNAAASPYPATLNVSGLSGSIISLKVRLLRLSHAYPEDIDILLVGPQGQKLLLMSDAGDNGLNASSVSNLMLIFSDSAPDFLPDRQRLTSGIYRPTNYTGAGDDIFPNPAPTGPYSATLSTFTDTNPNGTWSLYVRDDFAGGSGLLAAGWSLEIFSSDCATPFTVTVGLDNGGCGTLSKAISEANRAVAPVTISFDGVTSLSLTAPLPPLNNQNGVAITLDGNCLLDLNGNGAPRITLQPANNVTISTGLQLGSNVTLKALAFYGFSGFAVEVLGANNQLSCNWLGRPDALSGMANGGGLRLAAGSASTTLGEVGQPASRNLLSGNNGRGLQIEPSTGNISYYTWLGLDKNGNLLPNVAPTLLVPRGASLILREGNRISGG